MFSILVNPPSARPTSGRSLPSSTAAPPTESLLLVSKLTLEVASLLDSLWFMTPWTMLKSLSPSTDSSDRESLKPRLRPAGNRRRKERTEQRRSVVLPRQRLDLARSKQFSSMDTQHQDLMEYPVPVPVLVIICS